MLTVNIRTLEDKLSAYLQLVQRGEIVLVTDRGRVVAEIRQPTVHREAADEMQDKLERLVARGVLRLGRPKPPNAHRAADLRLPSDTIDSALDWTRGER